jgi:DNA-3-methyladenine glycosylase
MQLERQKGRRTAATAAVAHRKLQDHELCNGPAKLCMSFSITKLLCNKQDLTVWDGMWIEEDESEEEVPHIVTSHRIGIDSVGTEWASKPLRFYLLGNSSVSRRDKSREKQLQEMIQGSP